MRNDRANVVRASASQQLVDLSLDHLDCLLHVLYRDAQSDGGGG